MTVVELLRAARERIATPERWTQGSWARGAWGGFVPPDDTRAACWCLRGAVASVCVWPEDGRVEQELARTLGTRPHGGLADWNDAPERTHAEVLDLFDRTIARLEAAND